MTRKSSKASLASLFLPPGPGPALTAQFRTGTVLAWSPSSNTILVGNTSVDDVPCLDTVDRSSVNAGDTVSMLCAVDSGGLSTYQIQGRIIAPGDVPVGGYRYIATLTYRNTNVSSVNTYTFSKGDHVGLRAVEVECIGGGGGGAGAVATGVGQVSIAAGGAGASWAKRFIAVSQFPSSVTVQVGYGGGGGAGANGNSGGNSMFGDWASGDAFAVYGPGGAGGGTPPAAIAAAGTVVAGTGNGFDANNEDQYPLWGDIFSAGESAGYGYVLAGTIIRESLFGGRAGGPYGHRFYMIGTSGNPAAGKIYGNGSTGNTNGASAAARTGLRGAAGLVLIRLFG